METSLIAYLYLDVKNTSFDSDVDIPKSIDQYNYPTNYLTIYVAPTDTDVTLSVWNGSSFVAIYNIPNGFTWNGDIPPGLRYKITGSTFTVGLGVKK